MGKFSYNYTDSEEEDTSSSVETTKKKKKFSILKYSANNVKKKSKQSKSDPDYSNINMQRASSHRVRYKLPGILKNTNYREKERESSEEEDDVDYSKVWVSRDRCLVGRVPRPPGTKPGRGGGVAILVRKNVSGMQGLQGVQPQQSTSSTKRKRKGKLSRKRSY